MLDFIKDPEWRSTPDDIKQQILDLAFQDEIASDAEWLSTSVEDQQEIKNLYLQDAANLESEIYPVLSVLPAEIPEPMGDVEAGFKKGIQTTQAGAYGAAGLAGSIMEKAGLDTVGGKIKEWGMEGYARNMEEAKQYPTKAWSDVHGAGDFVDYIQGLAASQIPIIAETIIGTALSGGVGYGIAKTTLTAAAKEMSKKVIATQIKNGALKTVAKEAAEDVLEKAILKGFMKTAGRKTIRRASKAGMVGTVAQLESGLNYGELLEEHGVDAPASSLAFGTLSGFIELLGGNIGIVDDFVRAVAKQMPGSYLKRAAKRIVLNAPAEALQEAGQEVNSILNIVLNTDEKFLTPENMARIFESGVAGFIMGTGGAIVQAAAAVDSEPAKPAAGISSATTGDEAINAFKEDMDNVLKSTASEQQPLQAAPVGDAAIIEDMINKFVSDGIPLDKASELAAGVVTAERKSVVESIDRGIFVPPDMLGKYSDLLPEGQKIQEVPERRASEQPTVYSKAKPSPYFDVSEDAVEVPLADIKPRNVISQAEDIEKLARGKEKMAMAKEGKGQKRAPISVYKREDGTLVVLDGNTTYHALKDMGEVSAPVVIKKTLKQQNAASLDDIYAQAQEAKPVIEKMTEDFAAEMGGTAHFRKDKTLKDRGRAQDKVTSYGAVDRLKDVLATTISFKTEAEMRAALNVFDEQQAVMDIEDSFANPLPTGYKDISMVVRAPNGHLVEIQFSTDEMVAKKNGPGRVIYGLLREVESLNRAGAREIAERLTSLSNDFYSASSNALSSEMVVEVKSISDALGEGSIKTLLSPSSLNNFRDLSSNTKGVPSEFKNLSAISTPVLDNKAELPYSESILPDAESVKSKTWTAESLKKLNPVELRDVAKGLGVKDLKSKKPADVRQEILSAQKKELKDDVSKPPERDESDDNSKQRQQAYLDRVAKSLSKDRNGSIQRVEAKSKTLRAIEKFADTLGLKVVFWQSDTKGIGDEYEGFTDPTVSNEIFVNVKGPAPAVWIAMHEVGHQLESRHPDLYQKLVDILIITDENFAAYTKKANAVREGTPAEVTDSAGVKEELINDFMADQAMNPEFWQRMYAKDASLTEKIVKILIDMVKTIKMRLRGTQYVSNVSESLDALVDVMSQFALRQSEQVDELKGIGQDAGIKFSKSPGYNPKKTIKAYKLLQTKKTKPGELFPLFIGATTPTPIGEWVKAQFIPTKGYSERPGWHAGVLPIAPHLRQKSTGKRNPSRVWVEVEIPADKNWQVEADKQLTRDIRNAVPEDGYYRFETNKMQGDAWIIGGAVKINKVLSNEDIKSILSAEGFSPGEISKEFGPDEGGVKFSKQSTRVPTAISAAEDALNSLLTVQFSDVLKDTETLEKNVGALLEETAMRPLEGKKAGDLKAQADAIIDFMADNLVWLYNSMTADARERAKLWYDGASLVAQTWADRYGITKAQASGVLAVLSPNNAWFSNASAAERLLDIVHTKQDFTWSSQMTEELARIGAETEDKIFSEIKNKKLKDILDDPAQAARWVRIYDQTYNDRAYNMLTPEGGTSDMITTKSGSASVMPWGSYGEIAKAISIVADGRRENIHFQLGGHHKVRNFYNNIFNPGSAAGFVTIDTHAIGAAHLKSLGANSIEVARAFGTKGGTSSITGLKGTYPYYAEAYARAAKQLGVLPREMQSIAWEAKKGLFDKKGGLKHKAVTDIWSKYKKGSISLVEARNAVMELAGGLSEPTWAKTPFNKKFTSTYNRSSEEKISPVKVKTKDSEVTFEVAPDPGNEALTEVWNGVDFKTQLLISEKVASKIISKVMAYFNSSGVFTTQLGGYKGATNPSLTLSVSDYRHTMSVARMLGYALSQNEMMVVAPKMIAGTRKKGAATIELPQGWGLDKVTELYDNIYKLKHEGKPLATGHTTIGNKMVIINDSKLSDKEFASKLNDFLGDEFSIYDDTVYAAFISTKELSDASNKEKQTTTGSSFLQRSSDLRKEATEELERELKESGIKFSKADRVSKTDRQGSPGTVLRLTHWSHQKELTNLDPAYHGTGYRGAESKRKEADPDHWVNRTYLGIPGYKKEAGLGNEKYTISMPKDRLYDFVEDSLNLKSEIDTVVAESKGWAPDRLSIYEQLIKNAGFIGYISGDAVAVFEKLQIKDTKDVAEVDAMVKVRMLQKETGTIVEIEMSSKEALADIDSQSDILNKMIACME